MLVAYGSNGLRGSDQYWYVGDTQNIIDGDNSATTNIFFPGPILRKQFVERPNYVLHNSFMLPMAAFIGQFTGAYLAWIILNFLFHILVSLCLYYSALKLVGYEKASIVASVYLLAPIALWQVINPLLEMSFSAITALCLLAYVYRTHFSARILMALALCVGVVSHPIFIVLAIAWLGYRVFLSGGRELVELCYVFSLAFALGLAMYCKELVFPSSFQPSLEAIIVSAIPGKSNMFWHYSDIYPPVSLEFLFDKLLIASSKHFATVRFAPFYLFTNLAVVGLVVVALVKFRARMEYILPISIILGLYAGMIVLQQNHHRYQQIVAPAVFFSILLMVEGIPTKYLKKVALAVCAMLLMVNSFVMHTARLESVSEARGIEELNVSLGSLAKDARLVAIDIYPHNPITYVLHPREFLSVRTDLLGEGKIAKAIKLFDPTHILSSTKADDISLLGQVVYEQSFFSSFYDSEFYLYRYTPNQSN